MDERHGEVNVSQRGTYRVIAAELTRRIKDGTYAAGSLLPSEPTLAKEFGVARNTIRSALGTLEAAGAVEALPGQGRRIAGEPDQGVESTTAYERVAAALRAGIQEGKFDAELPLPSEVRLMDEHGVSRNTVRRAYRLLQEEGTIVIRHGAGAFVAPTADDAAQQQRGGR
ncbi:winged helix-turn-helix domain-containing protein [Saccharopolyspora gloriosae]|uniref:winged helix-turn-helix domain-containing protein n=1 Tax=Saccharopolyspora gloriosae TaxID=455344 RepID=UPI001FB7AC61|nr:winged helix-turn-helix domain-containing protein [Saccharopolyspora gloriosae]